MWTRVLTKVANEKFVNLVGMGIFGGIPAIIALFAGAGLASLIFGLAGTLFWFAFYLAKGLRKVEEKQFRVVERVGKYHRTLHEGLVVLCLPDIIDRFAPHGGDNGDFKYHIIEVNDDDPKNALDFKDGGTGTPVLSIMYRVIHSEPGETPQITVGTKVFKPNLPDKKDKDGAYLYVYVVQQSEDRIREVIMGSLRPLLQKKTVDDACSELIDISTSIRQDEEVTQALINMGVELDPHRGVILTDIRLAASIVQARDEAIIGKKNAEKQAAQGSGYINAILAIIEAGKKAGQKISFDKARGIYETQRGLEVLAQKPGSMNFVAPGINNALVSMNVSDPQQQQQKGGKP